MAKPLRGSKNAAFPAPPPGTTIRELVSARNAQPPGWSNFRFFSAKFKVFEANCEGIFEAGCEPRRHLNLRPQRAGVEATDLARRRPAGLRATGCRLASAERAKR